MTTIDLPSATMRQGPFGEAERVATLPTAVAAAMYMIKCGIDVSRHYHGHEVMELYRCLATGMHFWRPVDLAGDESFYREVSAAWPDYYQEWRWEYDLLDEFLGPGTRVLEVGCGRGYFLRHAEGKVAFARGLELNRAAIDNKVTRWPVDPVALEDLDAGGEGFDLICAFQVLEHLVDPAGFLNHCLGSLRPGGRLALSVPNFDHPPFRRRQDAFDLPPHHVNHFTYPVFERLAQLHGLVLERSWIQRRPFQLEAASRNTSRHLPYRLARKLTERIFQSLYDRLKEPGHTMLVVLKRP